MAGSQIERAFSLVESLTGEPQGLPLQTLAERLDIPKSAAHRMLTELVRLGYYKGIVQWLDDWVQRRPEQAAFAQGLRTLAREFRFEAIEQRLQQSATLP